MEDLAHDALKSGNTETARRLLHEAAGCYHVGQHFFYIDPDQKHGALEKIWDVYPRAIALLEEPIRPIRFEAPYRETTIPGYLRVQSTSGRPLIICINGMGTADWYPVLRGLCAYYRVLALDLPGVARSSGSDVVYGPDNYVKAIREVTQKRIGKPFFLLGHSMGGAIAMRYA